MNIKHEMRAAWISTVLNIDLTTGLSEDQYRSWAEDTIETLEQKNFNTVVFQIKPTADALYPSELAPWSRYITGAEQGVDPGYDPLQIMIDIAHMYGLELHAWINPYRVTMPAEELTDLTYDNIAIKHPDWIVKSGKQHYLNPGIPGVQNYLVEAVEELVENYDVDAVHMDDYFYPGVDFDDKETFEKHSGKFTDIGDWRRDNVNELVKKLNKAIKASKPFVQFGISPSGIWRNVGEDPTGSDTAGQGHYDALFADSQQWIKAGSIDYITPQIYWSREFDIANYSKLLDWWSKAVDPYPVNLYIGMADYRVNNHSEQAWTNARELPEQILENRNNGHVQGQMHFTLGSIMKNALNYGDIIKKELYHTKAVTPTRPWQDSTLPNAPEKIRLQKQPNGIKIQVDSPTKNARKFVVYRFADKRNIDYTDPSNVIGVFYNKAGATFIDEEVNVNQSHSYGVTAISPTGFESERGIVMNWPLENKST